MLLSVIVPVFNGEQVLPQLMESLLGQDFRDFEILLVNDGSTDGTQALCRAYERKDPRVRALHSENRGVSHARNLGLEAARGSWLQFADADDVLKPGMLRDFAREVRADSELLVCGCTRMRGERAEYCGPEAAGECSVAEALDGLPMERRYWLLDYVWNKWYRRETVGALRFREGLNLGEDFLFNTEYFRKIQRFQTLDQAYYVYRVGEGGLSTVFRPQPWEGRELLLEGEISLYQHFRLWRKNREELCIQAGRIAFGDLRTLNSPQCALSHRERVEFVEKMLRSSQRILVLRYLDSRTGPAFRLYRRAVQLERPDLLLGCIRLEKLLHRQKVNPCP